MALSSLRRDPTLTEEDPNKAPIFDEAFLRVCQNSINIYETRANTLQEDCKTMSKDNYIKYRQYLAWALAGLTVTLAATDVLFFLSYMRTGSDEVEKQNHRLWHMTWLSGSVWLSLELWKQARTALVDRTFKVWSWLNMARKNGYTAVSDDYDKLITTLEVVRQSLHNAFGKEDPSLQLVYFDLDREIDHLRKCKNEQSVNSLNRGDLKEIHRVLDQAKNVIQTRAPALYTFFHTQPDVIGDRVALEAAEDDVQKDGAPQRTNSFVSMV